MPTGRGARCAGESMTPTIQDGAMLIIDETQTKLRPFQAPPRKARSAPPKRDDIFVFFQGDDLRLKRLRQLDHGYVAILSDNHAENPLEILKPGREGAFSILGKVIWWDNRV